MKFLSFLKPTNARSSSSSSSSSSSWAWPSCHQPKTLSFRLVTTTTTFIDSKVANVVETFTTETSESFFSETPNSASFSTAASETAWDPVVTVIRGLRSDRLFFEPDETSSIFKGSPMTTTSTTTHSPFENSVVLSMDSVDPYADFRRSMEEMVETHGVGDWETLEELLCWYLKVNGKTNREYIVAAFVDLLFGLALASPACSELRSPPSSPVSFYSSLSSCSFRCAYCLEGEEEEEEEEEEVGAASSSFSLAQAMGEIVPVDEASSSSYSNT